MDYEYLFSRRLHEELKNMIKGMVYCKVINDTLVVVISTREGVQFEWLLENFAHKLILGLINPEMVAHVVARKYRMHVLDTFMY